MVGERGRRRCWFRVGRIDVSWFVVAVVVLLRLLVLVGELGVVLWSSFKPCLLGGGLEALLVLWKIGE